MPQDFASNATLQSPNDFSPGVILLDEMSGNFAWESSGTGADYDCEYSVERPFSGDKSLLMRTRATSAAATDYVTARRQFVLDAQKKMRIRFRYDYGDFNSTTSLMVSLQVGNGSGVMVYGITLDPNAQTLTYGDDDDPSNVDGTVLLHQAGNQWGLFDMQIDTQTGQYLILEVDGFLSDAIGKVVTPIPMASPRVGILDITLTAADGTRPEVYIDNLSITSLEVY